jgi:hypothetical protein
MNLIDLPTFFKSYREAFSERLTQRQVQGLLFLLDKMSNDTLTLREAAYLLATTKHETANTYQPIVERGNAQYFEKYAAHTRIGQQLGNSFDGDHETFKGRGYVQITGRANYAKFSTSRNFKDPGNLIDHPDNALEPERAYHILRHGIMKGLFTGVGLWRFVNEDKCDYINARKTVNGTDKAQLIADYAKKFELCLTLSNKP